MRGTTGSYSDYVDELALRAQDVARGSWRRIEEDVSLALKGQASERLRQLVSWPYGARRGRARARADTAAAPECCSQGIPPSPLTTTSSERGRWTDARKRAGTS